MCNRLVASGQGILLTLMSMRAAASCYCGMASAWCFAMLQAEEPAPSVAGSALL